MTARHTMNILLVDDRAEQRLSWPQCSRTSGRTSSKRRPVETRCAALLHKEFPIILLDVNMPGMDGFETAALIRQRRNSEHTPIIFITAYNDDAHALRGYSLGAVDYILAPVEPQVLRTKVAAFVELAKKNEEVKRQAASLRQRATQLHRLTEASLAINSELSVDRMLQIVTDRAAAIIGAHQAVTSTAVNQHVVGARPFIFLSDGYARWRTGSIELASSGIQSLARVSNLPMRMTQSELAVNRIGHTAGADRLPMRGWLAAALTGRDGRNLGVIQLSDKCEGEFTEDDEAILIQLAQSASIAVENIVYSQEHEANRLKDEFLATLSHELRTPLQAILIWARTLRTAETLDPAAVARAFEVIERSAKAQAKLIEDLLDVSRIINNKLSVESQPLDVVTVIDAAIDALRPSAVAAGIELRRVFGASSCQVCADPNRLQQIFWNLLSNAVKFTPKGGQVDVQLEQRGGEVRIRVRDTGEGIPADFLPYIFERFRQADSSPARARGGLGLGLFVVRRLVELHGGTVCAESPGKGHGATFTVELPILGNGLRPSQVALAAAASGSGPLFEPANGLRLDGVRVLIVDDEEDAREGLALALYEYGAVVTAVGSAAAALEAIGKAPPQVLICDVGMPGEDGYSLLGKIRARSPERGGQIPAAAVTAYARSEDSARARAAGFDAHVPKPVDPVDLARTVKDLLGKSDRDRASEPGLASLKTRTAAETTQPKRRPHQTPTPSSLES